MSPEGLYNLIYLPLLDYTCKSYLSYLKTLIYFHYEYHIHINTILWTRAESHEYFRWLEFWELEMDSPL